MNLTDEQLKAWLTALRSGKYKQANISLIWQGFSMTSYCCMGVAGKVCLNLPDEKMQGMGLLSSMNKHPFTDTEEICLARLNDTLRLSFMQIAAFVEGADQETWLRVNE